MSTNYTTIPAAHVIRPRCTLRDRDMRAYGRLTPQDRRRMGLPSGNTWWWCVLPSQPRSRTQRLTAPRIGYRVGSRIVYKVLAGFHRGRAVGIVGLR